jgi:hypothetical protein
MSTDPRVLTAEITADLCAARVTKRGTLGVFVEHVPAMDPPAFLAQLGKKVDKPIRVAVLGTSKSPGKAPAKITLTTSPTEANQWRNDVEARRGTPFVTLVLGSAPKLNSLRSAVPLLGPNELRAETIKRATALMPSPEREAFWKAIGNRPDQFALGSILELLAELTGKARTPAVFMEQEPAQVWRLGLIQHEALFSRQGPRGAASAIRRNLEIVDRLWDLSKRDRANIVRIVDQGDDEPLKACARAMMEFETTHDKKQLRQLDFDDVQKVLKGAEEKSSAPPPPKKQRLEGDALAVEILVDDNGRGIKIAAKRFKRELDPDPNGDIEPDEISVGNRRVVPRRKTGAQQISSTFGRLFTEEVWGGVVAAPVAKDYVNALKLLASDEAQVAAFRPTAQDNVRSMLERAVSQGWVLKDVLQKWDRYAALRAAVLPDYAPLSDHPLLALAGDEQLAAKIDKLLKAYDEALIAIRHTANTLRQRGSFDPAKRLLARTLVLDLVFIRTANDTVAVAGPTHPFHLWRWATIAKLLAERAAELRELGTDILKDLVSEPPPVSPSVLLTPFVTEASVTRSQAFVCVGAFSALPLFAEPSARNLSKFRARPLAKVAQRLLRLMPHASFGLRLALVDPLTVTGTIEEFLELESPFEDERAITLHTTIYRTRPSLDATDEEDEDLEEISRAIHDSGGTISVIAGTKTAQQIADELDKNPAHLTIVFQPGIGSQLRVGITAPPALSPLVVPRAYKYDEYDDRLDVIVAGEGAPFLTYHMLFCEALDMPTSDFVGRRSGASAWSQELAELAKGSIWCTVIDQALEPTLNIGNAMRLDWRSDAGRDIVTFTSRPETIRELVVEAIRQAGLIPNDATVTRTFEQVQRLSGEALLALARTSDGTLIDSRVARGTLGVVAAARWYERTYPDALMISLDDSLSRRWVLGHADMDNRHGDLVAVRMADDGAIIDAVEVKAHQDASAGLTIKGSSAEGKAAIQVDQTIKTLRKLLCTPSKDLSQLDRARQDILRDHLYRAVASRPYSRDKRARLVELLTQLFENGASSIEGLIFRITIESKTAEVFPISPKFYKTPANNRLGIVDIIETEASGGRSDGEGSPPAPPTDKGKNKPGKAPTTATQRAKKTNTPSRDSGPGNDSRRDTTARIYAERAKPHSPTPTPPAATGKRKDVDPRILIGESSSGEQVFWEPHRSDAPLNNFGLLVTGDSGAGKTQILRALIHEVADLGLPVCVFDFKNDYADPVFSKTADLRVYDVSRVGLPFNPLSMLADDNGECQPITQIHTLADIFRRIFGLGEQQQARLKKALVLAYETFGIDPKRRYRVAEVKSGPNFDDVIKLMEGDEKNEAVLNRLAPLFDLNLFPKSDAVTTTFEALINARVVLDLHSLPEDRIKAALAEFMIVRLHGYVLRGDQPRQLRRVMVFDEAWRVKDSERLQELAREGRAFGVGIAIGTQFPGDIRENLAGNLATQIFLHNKEADHQRAIARALVGTTSGPKAIHIIQKVGMLQKHEGFVRNQQHLPYVLVRTTPHYERGQQ